MQSSKRHLTSDEIEDILDVIRCSNSSNEDTQTILNARESLRVQLKNVQLYPEMIEKFKQHIEAQYYKSLLQPGEMVGVIAASSIGEQNTQASLNRYYNFQYFNS